MANGSNEEVLINALRWQAKLQEHAQLWNGPGDLICPGCRTYVAAVMQGTSPALALKQACPTIQQARAALFAARELATRLTGEAGF